MRRKPLGICVVCGASCYPFDNQCQDCVEKKYLQPEELVLLPMIQHRQGKLQVQESRVRQERTKGTGA